MKFYFVIIHNGLSLLPERHCLSPHLQLMQIWQNKTKINSEGSKEGGEEGSACEPRNLLTHIGADTMSLYPDLNCNFDLRLAMPYSRICERTSPTAMDGEITSKVIELVIFWFEVFSFSNWCLFYMILLVTLCLLIEHKLSMTRFCWLGLLDNWT